MSFDELFEKVRKEIKKMWREFEETLRELEERPMWDTTGRLEPLVSREERHDSYVILIDLPYADLKSLSIEFRGRKIRVECKLSRGVRFDRWTVSRETVFNRYYTEIELPEDADTSKAVIEKDENRKIVRIRVPRRLL